MKNKKKKILFFVMLIPLLSILFFQSRNLLDYIFGEPLAYPVTKDPENTCNLTTHHVEINEKTGKGECVPSESTSVE